MKVTALSGYKLSLPTMLITTALLLQSCQSQPEIQVGIVPAQAEAVLVEPQAIWFQSQTVQVEFLEPPVASTAATTWNLVIDKMSFNDAESMLSDTQTAPWWGNEEMAMKFMSEYFVDHFLEPHLEQEGLSGMKVGTVPYLPGDEPIVAGTPYVAYEKSEGGVRAFAIHEPSFGMTGGMQPAMLFPVVPIEISIEDDVIYLTASPVL
jgi:hypothetical protein